MLVFGACNKDEEIIVDLPEIPETPGDESKPDFTVLEYMPAPGQFINERASGFIDVDTKEKACLYAQDRLEQNLFVSLGAWGGYLVVRSEQRIHNTGGFDFGIYGNAFDTSNEAGIVWVMQDTNGNGIPDEKWIELKGSYYGKEGFEKDYWVRYDRPAANSDVKWTDSNGNSGIIKWIGAFHSQESYYPLWIDSDSYTLHGSKLPSKAIKQPNGQWSNPPYEWGYADNSGDDSEMMEVGGKLLQKNRFKISNAVAEDGSPVHLEYIDFIKVQTGICGNSDILGENSTEVCGFCIE